MRSMWQVETSVVMIEIGLTSCEETELLVGTERDHNVDFKP